MPPKITGRGKSELKRQQILTAAADLFLASGFDGVSMDGVAGVAGVSKQTVYSHFGSKEELFSAVISNECDKNELNAELFNPELPVKEVLLELANHFNGLLLSDGAIKLHRICAASAEHRCDIAELFWQAGPKKLYTLFRQYLTTQVDKGQLCIDNIDFATEQFLFMVKGEAQMRKLFGLSQTAKDEIQQRYIKSCVALFLSGYSITK